MSFEDLQAAITKALPDQAQRDTARHSASVAMFGPVDERPNVITLDRAVELRDTNPDQYATLPAETRRQAEQHAEWRKTHPKSTEGADQ